MPELDDPRPAAIGEHLRLDEMPPEEAAACLEELRRLIQAKDNPNLRPLGHELVDARSLALHRVIADHLVQDPQLVPAARRRVEKLLAEGHMHPVYAKAWLELLDGPRDRLLEVLCDPGERATALRQCTPFVGVLKQSTRLRILREVREGKIA